MAKSLNIVLPYYYVMFYDTKSNQNIDELSDEEIKNQIIRDGLFPQYIKRIKNLEKIEEKLWKLETKETDPTRHLQILINIGNLQSITSNCYVAATQTLQQDIKGEFTN